MNFKKNKLSIYLLAQNLVVIIIEQHSPLSKDEIPRLPAFFARETLSILLLIIQLIKIIFF